MGDDLLRHCSSQRSGRLRKDAALHKAGHAFASAHKQNPNTQISSQIPNSTRSSLEENQFAPYFMDNHKRRPNTDQTMPKLASAKPSPSIIAKLMGLKDLPLENGLEKADKKSGGSFHKPSLSGLMKSRNVEFKDVFEVIEDRSRQQQDKGQNRKDFIKNKAFQDDTKKHRNNFVKNIEKSNPLFAKHLLDLKCYPPHLHKGIVSRSKPGYVNEHTSTRNLKMKNLGPRNSQHDHIVILDPKMGNIDQDPKSERTLHQQFWDNLENRRNKIWRFETIRHQESECCKRNILKLERLRRSDLNLSNEGTKSLAEMLATPDMERDGKNFDSHNYYRKLLKSKFAREGYYEKAGGSCANLPQDISQITRKNSLLEREDVVKLRARKQKLKENITLKGNYAGRFCEKEIYMEKHDQMGRSGDCFEIEEKMVFTIDERQDAGPTTSHFFAKEAKKHGHVKMRASIEEEECFSIVNLNRSTNSNEAEIPSPISVLEPTLIETESSCSSIFKPDFDHHENDMKIKEDLEICTWSDDDSQLTTCNNNISTLNQLRDQEEREFSYLLDMLIQSGIHGVCSGTLQRGYHSHNYPVDPRLFDRLERRYGHMSTWSKYERRLLFDLVNSVLAIVLAPYLVSHPWVRVRCNRPAVGSAWGPEGMVERVWLVLSREREKIRSGEVEDQLLDFNLGDDINVIGKQIERMLTDQILEETVLAFLSTDR
ncbi:Phosphatidylinositol N-acetyglucosaminlytransferase subunit P-like protein [Rhynchospora pubera]|uniref:Phosphatidylinositol N-acetyglucosaminlytransferase subunit P-like protein n=1 Tax=Rhynchospora pubera TaxID=906938 RepID=A0AAV8DZJ0_9POAL|nr:Phosphatidylinositol N-acetyglucosaminlytransferase subunit P-like protein [Rhynchospora pubera]KAJ4779847.1 Phosphatidylinositol N-acetyglucosaminlytransferase subunit P-like protein [Rhynchospora pubera]